MSETHLSVNPAISLPKRLIATLAGFVATFVGNTLLAIFVLGPLVNARLRISRDPVADGLNFPAILAGYLGLTLFLVWLVPHMRSATWVRRGLVAGIATGTAANVSSYLIVAGWSIADGPAMLFSGVIDALATVLGALVIAFILRTPERRA